MESTINRKEYRREIRDEDAFARKTVERMEPPVSNIRFFSKVVNVMFLLLDVLLIKFFGYGETFDRIKYILDSGISLDEIKTSISRFYQTNQAAWEEKKDMLEEKQEERNFVESQIEETTESKSGEVEELSSIPEQIKNEYGIQSPVTGTITSPFGMRVSNNPSISSYHTGIDIAANQGTSVVAAHDGTVIQAGANGNYGISITIQKAHLTTLYGHCEKINVKKGEEVKAGQTIGQVGMTGNATGPHLHFEVKYSGELVNPQELI